MIPEVSAKAKDVGVFFNELPKGAVLLDNSDNVINNPDDGKDPFAEINNKIVGKSNDVADLLEDSSKHVA